MASDYPLSRPLAGRLLGVLIAALGGVVVLLTVAVALLGLPTWVLSGGALLVGVLVVLAAVLLTRSLTVVRLDDVGYQVRFIRGAGTTAARWSDVEDVVASTRAGERCVVLRLRDGRTTTVPVRMLAGSSDDFVRDLQEHLNTGRGYRRLN